MAEASRLSYWMQGEPGATREILISTKIVCRFYDYHRKRRKLLMDKENTVGDDMTPKSAITKKNTLPTRE